MGAMATVFDTAATVRALKDAGLERPQAEAIATACRKAAEVAEPVTQAGLDAAVSQLETRLTWRLIYVAAVVVAAIKVIPSLY